MHPPAQDLKGIAEALANVQLVGERYPAYLKSRQGH